VVSAVRRQGSTHADGTPTSVSDNHGHRVCPAAQPRRSDWLPTSRNAEPFTCAGIDDEQRRPRTTKPMPIMVALATSAMRLTTTNAKRSIRTVMASAITSRPRTTPSLRRAPPWRAGGTTERLRPDAVFLRPSDQTPPVPSSTLQRPSDA
jgi:hypothetical protein